MKDYEYGLCNKSDNTMEINIKKIEIAQVILETIIHDYIHQKELKQYFVKIYILPII